jgi:hypothetical protein
VAVLLNVLLLISAVTLTLCLFWARSERRYLKLLARLREVEAREQNPEAATAKTLPGAP